ncbi:SDR family oxidoreductase [Vibrio mexicanus]|uniref:SDR family oxidoreductase n=1 Tax=Vibrio mexicanus TaxID=1004326 RepID=UPI00063CB6C2|nr:SDR family oxidoreductase [Vibrio mexicanus]
MKVLVLGASGGIGSAMVKLLESTEPEWEVHATYNNNAFSTACQNTFWHPLDVTSEHEVKALAAQIGHIDWIINAVGMLHNSDFTPEKRLKQTSSEQFMASMQVNALPTLLLAKHFESNLKKSEQPRLVTVSARVGSIEDNRLGGWYSYRASKSALNMLIKTISIEWGRTFKKAAIFAFHPGTTDTSLSKPFQANVPEGKLFTPAYVAQCLISQIEKSCLQNESNFNGKFLAYDGSEIPW